MKWITNPDLLADALAALLADGGNTEAHDKAQADAREVLAQHAAGVAGTLPLMEKYGRADMDLDALLDNFDTVFHALAAFRNGTLILETGRNPETLATIAGYISALVHKLEPRLKGLTAACVRAHYAAGGSHGELATAMDTNRATAQTRGTRICTAEPSTWENWATGELEIGAYPAADLRPGWTFEDSNGKRHQVQAVQVYADGLVEIQAGSAAHCFAPKEKVQAVPHPAANVLTSTGEISTSDGKTIGVTTYTRTTYPSRGQS